MSYKNIIEIADKLRPCDVDGRKALFYGFIVNEKPVLSIDSIMMNNDKLYKKIRWLCKSKIEKSVTVHIQKEVRAIVELEDGRIAEIEPTKIRFLDNYFSDETIPVKFKPGDKIYYKNRKGELQESTIKSVEPLYTHETPEGDKCIFYDNFIGSIIFPRV